MGDEVVTTDPESKAESTQRITGVVKHENIPVYVVGTPQGEVKTTGDHPFWVKGRGWVRAENLHLGDELIQPNNTSVHITSVGYNGEVTTVYNITTAKNHDFYVKAGSVWLLVHNNDCNEWRVIPEKVIDKKIGPRGLYWKNKDDDLWWSRDIDKHGGSEWKVFKETNKGLEWKADADKNGKYLTNKHKGQSGYFIPWKDLH